MYEHNGNTILKHESFRFGQSLEFLFWGDLRVEEYVEIFAVSSLLPGLWMLADEKINGKLC